MFSATTTKKTEDLVKVALKKEPIYIGIEEKSKVMQRFSCRYFTHLRGEIISSSGTFPSYEYF